MNAALPEHDRLRAPAQVEPRVCPLSFTQEGIWFIGQLEGETAIHHMAQAFRLIGPIDQALLERSLQGLIERHAGLRTAFQQRDGLPVQVVLPAAEVAPRLKLVLRRVEGAGAADREQELGERLQDEVCRPFDLTQPPLLRACLFRLHESEHVLLVVTHEIVADGWSMGLMLGELGALYAARSPRDALAPPPSQFVDFVRRQRDVVAGDAMGVTLQYWRHQLAGVETLDMPTDRVRGARFSYHGRVHRFPLPLPVCEALRHLAHREQTSVFVLLLAAFKLLLQRYARQNDVAVGVAVAGRRMGELDGVVGCLSNTLVMRSDLSDDPRFAELVQRVRRTVDEGQAHQDLPFDLLVTALSPKRDLSRNPLYQVAFALKPAESPRLVLDALQVTPVALHTETAKLDLTLAVTEDADGAMHGVFEYATELFDGATVARMAGHWRHLLEGIVAAPDSHLSELSLTDAAERGELLELGGAATAGSGQPLCVHELIQEQARRSPEADAVVCGERRLSYRELDERATAMALRLRALGVGPDVAVALCVKRALDLPAWVLAILKAGGIYVPIDPEDTIERRHFVLQDCGAAVFITQSDLVAGDMPASVHLLQIDADEAAVAVPPAGAVPETVHRPDAVAYVIYTSGSTGQPKGVQIAHRGICNHMRWIARACQVGPADRLLHKTSISFDASIVELLMPLSCGASVVLAEVDGERDTDYLLTAIAAHRISVLQMVPTALRVLLQEPHLERCASLRYLVCGGEALDADLAREAMRLLPGVTMGNFYGPTEASIDATWHELRELPEGAGRVPIGRPIAHMRCHVLDPRDALQPIGVPGELCIGGVGLARGYLNRPELTAERFVADPFRPGERLYRTGDLARWRADGTLEYMGRLDHQVKLRGYRIELGEIEAALQSVAGVRRCAVVLREDRPGMQQLVAYVVGEVGDLATLREQLRRQLPEHMLPAAVVGVPALPLLPSGKLDRRALPAPGSERRARWVEPVTATERALAQIWRELLKVERVGATDDFFELGGHSLLAARLVRRIEERLQRRCSLAMLFRARSLQRIAAELDDGGGYAADGGAADPAPRAGSARATERAELVALQGEGSGPPLFCICGIHLYQQLADRLAPHARVYGIFLPYEQALLEAPSSASARLPSVEEMAADYVQAIRSQQPHGPYYLTGVSYGGALAFEIAQQLVRAGEQVALLAMLDTLLARSIPRDWRLWIARRLHRGRNGGGKRVLRSIARHLGHLIFGRRGSIVQDAATNEYLQIVAIRDRIYDLAMQAYTPSRYDGPAILVRADLETFDAADGVDPGYGWSRLIPRLHIHDAPGDHLGILSEPNVASLAAFLATRIALAQPDPTPAAPAAQDTATTA